MNHKKSLRQILAGFSGLLHALSIAVFFTRFLVDECRQISIRLPQLAICSPSLYKFKFFLIQRCFGLFLLALVVLSAPVGELTAATTIYLADGSELNENSLLPESILPVLFVHGHDFFAALNSENPNYQKNWQDLLEYSFLDLKLPSFKIALNLPQNSHLGIEPYYIHFEDQDRSIVDDAREIREAIDLILARHQDPTATNVKVVIIAYSKGTISTRLYLKSLVEEVPDLRPPPSYPPGFQPVSEFIAISPPNHGLNSCFAGDSLAFKQLNNGYDEECIRFGNDNEYLNFIEDLNGHPIEDSERDSQQQDEYTGEAPGSRVNGTPPTEGVLYVALYADNNRDVVGGDTPSNDCQGRVLAKNLAPHAVNILVSDIPGFTSLGVHANTVHTPQIICLALYIAVHHRAPPPDLTCTMIKIRDMDVPIIPLSF